MIKRISYEQKVNESKNQNKPNLELIYSIIKNGQIIQNWGYILKNTF